jgi:Tol biopolymer transport system component
MKILSIILLLCFPILLIGQEQMTNNIGWEYHPKWNPLNENEIYYTYQYDGEIDIFLFNTQTNEDNLLPIYKAGSLHFDITPDGNTMIFDARETPDEPINLYSLDLVNGSVELIVGYSRYPAISPDGSKIVYAGPNSKMYSADIDGSNAEVLISYQTDYEISDWSIDGTQIAFTSEQSGNSDIWIVNNDGSDLTQLTSSTNRDFWPCWSPYGDQIVYCSEEDGNSDIWIINVDGTGLTHLIDHPGYDTHPEWSKDGNTIMYASLQNGDFNIWAYEFETNSIKTVNSNCYFEVFPNPTSEEITLRFLAESPGIAKCRLLSIDSLEVFASKFQVSENGEVEYHVVLPKSLKPGIYILELSMGNYKKSKKINFQ